MAAPESVAPVAPPESSVLSAVAAGVVGVDGPGSSSLPKDGVDPIWSPMISPWASPARGARSKKAAHAMRAPEQRHAPLLIRPILPRPLR